MRRAKLRLAAGLVSVLLVTTLFAGAVAAPAALAHEVSDADTCDTAGGTDDSTATPPDDVTDWAGNVIECIVGDGDTGAPGAPKMK